MSKSPIKPPPRRRKRATTRSISTNSTNSIIQEITFAEALELFVTAKKAEGMRVRTIADYHVHMKYFVQYLKEFYPEKKHIQDITTDVIRNYITYLRDGRSLAHSTINIRLRTLRCKLRFWHAEGYLESNPFDSRVKLLRTDHTTPKMGLSEKEVKQLLSVLDKRTYTGFRDYVIILLLIDCGLRINELCHLELDHFDLKQSTVTVPSHISKNRKSRVLPITRKVLKLIFELHEENKKFFDESNFLFLTYYGDQMESDTFRRRLNTYSKKTGLNELHPHRFRHTFAKDYLLSGGDIVTLQLLLGHSDLSTTRRYLNLDSSHIKEQHRKHSPVTRYLK
jgi:integrase/recombinase XerD